MAEPNAWLEAALDCDAEAAEAVAEVFSRFAPGGVVLQSLTRFDAADQEEKATGMMRVAAYLPADAQLEEKRQRLQEALGYLNMIQPIGQARFTPIADQDWMALWKEHYSPIPIGKNLMVLPAWAGEEKAAGRLPIIISPDMAFGTGSHPSTQLCLLALEKYGCKGLNVIDIGSGSGILSIAAARMGAARVLGVDNDADAIPSAQNNAALNGLGGAEIRFEIGTHSDLLQRSDGLDKAPRVLANILAPILRKMLETGLADTVEEGGLLIMGGILKDQARDLIMAAEPCGLRLLESISEGDWVVLVMKKPRPEADLQA